MNKHGIKQLAVANAVINISDTFETFTAKVSTLRRDVATGVPKRTLRDIFDSNGNLFRDHCHVKETAAIRKLNNNRISRTNGWLIIEFSAKVQSYNYHNSGVIKQTLTNVKNVKILGKA